MNWKEVEPIRKVLLAWYDAHARVLPWRALPGELPDPYRVWISEVMLQQTRVEAVRPYFERWLKRFPDVGALAEADPDAVLSAWEGLGYYSRARNLHSAARIVVREHGGRIPPDPAAFRSLPGVGPYTAGAVLSIAFGLPEPIVDGNVRRLFARLLDLENPSAMELWGVARQFAAGERPGDLNQALMDFGATVCRPRSPRCGECPIAIHCRAREADTVSVRPLPAPRRELPGEEHVAVVVEFEDQVLLVKRPPRGRMGGMWEFPGGRIDSTVGVREAAGRAVARVTGLRVAVTDPLGQIAHALTHVRLIYHAFRGSPLDPPPDRTTVPDAVWVRREELGNFAMPRAQRRIWSLRPILAEREDQRDAVLTKTRPDPRTRR